MRHVLRPASRQDAHNVEIGERTIRLNSTVIEVAILRIIGSVTKSFCIALAPSIVAAS